MLLTNNVIIQSIKKSLELLPNSFRKRAVFLLLGIIINSFLDLLGLAAILPLLAAILKEGFIQENSVLSFLYHTLNCSSEIHFIVFLCVLILSFIVVKNLFGLWIQKTQVEFTWDAYESVSSDMFLSAYKKGYSFFNQENSNKILNRIVGVPSRFSQMLLTQLFLFLNEVVILVLVIFSLLIYDVKILILLGGIVVPVFVVFYRLNKSRISYYNERLNDIGPLTSKPVFETVFGYVDVAIGGVFNHFKGQYLKHVKESKVIRTRLGVIQQIPNRLVELCVVLAVIIMLLYGVFVLEDASKIIGLLSVFGLAAYRSIPSINRLMLSLVNVKGQMFNFDVFGQFLPFEKEGRILNDLSFYEKLELKDLSFKFSDSDKNTICSLNLTIQKGEAIGIVGKSGSGKTTLMNILLGFLEQTGGDIYIDNVKLSGSTIQSWQKKVGYVRQDVFLVDGNVRENIAFGIPKDKVDFNKLNDVIAKAQLSEIVDSLPEGIETNIGERGAKISGGQRQRVGIARALYHDAEVLFFDEATSALDSETESEITEAIRSLHSENLTMVIIAHRESTLKYCDRIINLSKDD